ncbi:3-demethylubiquinone-9 3-methyltransferase [Afipia felis]|uniref:3-demethylubiquinone-9 3-methyltransferase n=1 Tax=Afipia felis TaxID=1035 RepID=A0A090MV62_AFIFE|nr:class I SAM-dependent methyltransferase [Afipia felis]CEG09784.1 3-demethylubiquinone-9 3-methyltransferase [Afipia felis]
MTRISHIPTKEVFESKYLTAADVVADWLSNHGGLKDKRVLDFGCGEGLQAAAICARMGARSVLGVDINNEHLDCQEILKNFAPNASTNGLSFKEIAPGEKLGGEFDVVFSWSALEHVDLKLFDDVIQNLRSVLTPGGYFFFQVAPLYYSEDGAHLWALGWTNWEHLTSQISHIKEELRIFDKATESALWGMYATLNMMTSNQMIARIENCGFSTVRIYKEKSDRKPPKSLLDVYCEEALLTKQVVGLFQAT